MLFRLMKITRWGFAFDVRGLDQDLQHQRQFRIEQLFGYKETLDTTYYGGYFGIGGEYSLLFPGVSADVGSLALLHRPACRSLFRRHRL